MKTLTQPKQLTTAHIVPNWRLRPGHTARALCGRDVYVPRGHPAADEQEYIVCPLYEAAMMLDGMPPEPGTYSQLKLF